MQQKIDIIANAYNQSRGGLLKYFGYRVSTPQDAEDLCQDVFVRLIEYQSMLHEATVEYFIKRIARNLMIDYYRRHQVRRDAQQTLDYYEMTRANDDTVESEIIAKDIARYEQVLVSSLPQKRRLAYELRRYAEVPVKEIALRFNVSERTIENNYAAAAREIRTRLRACI